MNGIRRNALVIYVSYWSLCMLVLSLLTSLIFYWAKQVAYDLTHPSILFALLVKQ